MREFFRGWRRKFGIVTLVMALAFASIWVRSYRTEDTLTVLTRGNFEYCVHSHPEGIWIERRMTFKDGTESTIRFPGVVGTPYWPIVPNWWIVLPLTAISAYLLLSKHSAR